MDYNLITPTPLKPGYGLIFQGGWIDKDLWSLPMPLFVVQMDEYHCDHRSVNHRKGFIGVLSLNLLDTPILLPDHATGNAIGPLPDDEYIAAVECAQGYLRRGINVLSHCAAGVSRSSYITLGILMSEMEWSFEESLAYLKAARPKVIPNPGFEAHLRRLEPRLRRQV